MNTVFLGEEGNTGNHKFTTVVGTNKRTHAYNNQFNDNSSQIIDAWLEIWDYAGGCNFRGFVGGSSDQKSLFVFFDSSVIGRDLKQGLMELIELAESILGASMIVLCVDRSISDPERSAMLRSLRWVGFDLITLDMWAKDTDVVSDKWIFFGMEV